MRFFSHYSLFSCASSFCFSCADMHLTNCKCSLCRSSFGHRWVSCLFVVYQVSSSHHSLLCFVLFTGWQLRSSNHLRLGSNLIFLTLYVCVCVYEIVTKYHFLLVSSQTFSNNVFFFICFYFLQQHSNENNTQNETFNPRIVKNLHKSYY